MEKTYDLEHVNPATAEEAVGDTVTQTVLNNLNIAQQKEDNKNFLEKLGGVEGLAAKLHLNIDTGLTKQQVLELRAKFGDNKFPESPLVSFFELLFEALTDTTLIILMVASIISLVVGGVTDPAVGWIEGAAILIAVILVSNFTAFSDYSKQLQFRALENSSAEDERTSVLRDGSVERINPQDIVVGDIIVLQ
eukprot:gene16242-22109_t